jgi:hypothetical protein
VRRFTSAARKKLHTRGEGGWVNFLRQTADFIRSAPSPSLALAVSFCSAWKCCQRKENTRARAQIVIKSCCSIKKFASLRLGEERGAAMKFSLDHLRKSSAAKKPQIISPRPGHFPAAPPEKKITSPLFSRATEYGSGVSSLSAKKRPVNITVGEIFRCLSAASAPLQRNPREIREMKNYC